ncbi:MAG: YetF domain-containing protein [Thermoanaerobaculia bacterium]|jgi:uncharacterized membrane protein YcaP (DUF421 family)
MSSLLTTWPGIGLVVLRTAVVYLAILFGLRLAGKREVGQMTPFDLVLLLLLSNAVQNAMVGPDNSLVGGLAAAAVLIVLNFAVGRLAARSRAVRGLVKGHARLLVNRGILVQRNLDDEGITREDLMQALREHGVATVEDVRLAVLEVDGTISVLKNEDVTGDTHRPHRRFRFRKTN